jgi:TetR/AcrR family transcriptional repressor of mexJK operon
MESRQKMSEEQAILRPGRPKDTTKCEEIVAAATELFMQNGYELTSMEAVAREAGVSKLTIYSHFADKKELFRAIIQQRCDRLGLPESFIAEAQLPVEQSLFEIATYASGVMFRPDSIRLMRIVQAEAGRHPEMVQVYYEVGPRRLKTAFADLLRDFDRQGQLSIADPVRATEQFFSLLKGEKLMRMLMLLAPAPDSEELAAHVRATVNFFLAAYRPQKNGPQEDHPQEKSSQDNEGQKK